MLSSSGLLNRSKEQVIVSKLVSTTRLVVRDIVENIPAL